jgi:Ca-activated chloride channel family protein
VTIAQLAHPEWFEAVVWTLGVVGFCVALAAWHARRRRLILMGSASGPPPRKWTSDWALWIALVAIGIALVGPRIGERLIETSANGVDLVLVIDVSRSMDAPDTPPSRLDRARRGVEELLERLEPTDRVALAAFAGRGVLLAPLTPDRFALVEWIAALDTSLIRPSSSHLASGIRAAVGAFEAGSERPRVILVASDGEDPNHANELGIAEALSAQSRVIAIALGTELGSAIPASDTALRDHVGRVIVTRRDGDRLGRLADATSGALFRADEWGAFDFDAVAAEVRRDAGQVPGEPIVRSVQAIRVAPFAALALLLLLAEGLPRMGIALRSRAASAAALGLGVVLIGAAPGKFEAPIADTSGDERAVADAVPLPTAVEPWVRREPHNVRALIALGHSRFAHGEPEAAATAFATAALYAKDARLAAHSHFGLGIARLESGKFEAARDAFFDALAFDPSDDKARFNLEWTLAALIEKSPEAPRPDNKPGPDSDSKTQPDDSDEGDDEGDDEPAASSPSAPDPEAQRSAKPDTRDPHPSKLSEKQQLRSLARVSDDLERSIRAAASADADPFEKPRGAAW